MQDQEEDLVQGAQLVCAKLMSKKKKSKNVYRDMTQQLTFFVHPLAQLKTSSKSKQKVGLFSL
jgi:hypothetical protein